MGVVLVMVSQSYGGSVIIIINNKYDNDNHSTHYNDSNDSNNDISSCLGLVQARTSKTKFILKNRLPYIPKTFIHPC